MKILLTGASGFIGGHICQALQREGHEVACADRQHGVDFNQMQQASDWRKLLTGVDAVINSVGIIVERRSGSFINLHQKAPAALFTACVQENISRVVQISALGADDQAFTPYQRTKKAADDMLRGLPLKSFVLRPSLVIGAGSSSLAMFRRMAALPLLALADGGRQRIQPIHIDDLVATVLKCLTAPAEGSRTLDLAGPQPMSFADWLGILRQKQGKPPPRIVPLPFGLVLASARIGRFLLPLMHPDNLLMLQQGNTADTAPLEAFLGRPLTPVENAL
ncbi:NAD-dependent epimerase/dehydratase family protein [Thiolapillus sp.]